MFKVGDKVVLKPGASRMEGQDENWSGTVTHVEQSIYHHDWSVVVDDLYVYVNYSLKEFKIEKASTTLQDRIEDIYIPDNTTIADFRDVLEALRDIKAALLQLEKRSS